MEQQFAKLDTAIKEEDFEKVIQISDLILLKYPNDIEANKCKVITLMKQEKYADAIRVINKIATDKVRQSLAFEKAYSLYSLKKYAEAEALLSELNSKTIAENDSLLAVKAQLLFRVNKFAECHDAYQTLLRRAEARLAKSKKKSDDDDDVTNDVMELNANLCAAYCEAGEAELCAKLVAAWHFGEETDDANASPCAQAFECGFNAACHYAGAGDVTKGTAALAAAEELYRDYLSGDDDDDDDASNDTAAVAAALAGFTAQRGYFDVIGGDRAGGLEKYIRAHDDSRATSEVKIISANNSAALGEAPSVALKKIIAACHNDVAYARLSARQRAAISLTKVILLARMGNSAKLSGAIADYVKMVGETDGDDEQKKFANETGEIIFALCTKSTEKLAAFCSENASPRAVFTLAQLYLSEKKYAEAAECMCAYLGADFVAQHKGVAAAVVRLLDLAGDGEKACDMLVKCAEKNRDDALFIKVIAEILRKRKRPQQCEYVLGLEKKKKEAASSKKKEKVVVDPKKVEETIAAKNISLAEKMCKDLEPLPDLPATLSLDALEALPQPPAVNVPVTSSGDVTKPASAHAASASAAAGEKKKKKKRKVRLPKNYDPTKKPDPKRWLPKAKKGAQASKGKGKGKGGKGKGKSQQQQHDESLVKGLPGARDAALEEKLGAHDEETLSQQALEKAAATLPKAVRQGGGGRKVNKKQKKKY